MALALNVEHDYNDLILIMQFIENANVLNSQLPRPEVPLRV